jgi:putative ABC transport system substrate-binding protein
MIQPYLFVRRTLFFTVLLMWSAVCLPCFAEDGEKQVIIIETMPVRAVTEQSRWCVAELTKLGTGTGPPPHIKIIKAMGSRNRATSLLKAAVADQKPDVVVTFATLASQAAHEVLGNTDIPIAFFTVSDPVGAGLVKEIGKPTNTNVTGRVFTLDRERKIKMLLRLVKNRDRPVRFGIIHSDYPSAMGDVKALKQIASTDENVDFISVSVPYRPMPDGLDEMLNDVKKAISTLENRINFWWQPSGPLGEVPQYTDLLISESQIPIAYGNTVMSVKKGALLTLNPDFEAGGKEAAKIVYAILKGANPGDIPVVPPAGFHLGVNLKTALTLGVVIPSDMMMLAEGNIFH